MLHWTGRGVFLFSAFSTNNATPSRWDGRVDDRRWSCGSAAPRATRLLSTRTTRTPLLPAGVALARLHSLPGCMGWIHWICWHVPRGIQHSRRHARRWRRAVGYAFTGVVGGLPCPIANTINTTCKAPHQVSSGLPLPTFLPSFHPKPPERLLPLVPPFPTTASTPPPGLRATAFAGRWTAASCSRHWHQLPACYRGDHPATRNVELASPPWDGRPGLLWPSANADQMGNRKIIS